MSVQLLTLEKISCLFDQISNILESTIGKDGKAILINQKSPKSVTITKCGLDILACFDMKNDPVIKIIIEIVRSHNERFGDGTKTIIIGLRFFIRFLINIRSGYSTDESDTVWRSNLIKQISRVRSEVFPKLAEDLMKTKGIVEYNKRLSKDSPTILSKVVEAFMSTRFQTSVSQTMSSLIVEYIKKECGNRNYFSIGDLSRLFESRCIEVVGLPLQQSKLLEGFLLGKHVTLESTKINKKTLSSDLYFKDVEESPKILEDFKRNCRFIIWINGQEDQKDENQKIFSAESETSVGGLMKIRSSRFQTFLSRCKSDLEIDLIIYNHGLPEFSRMLCQKFDIAVIEYAPKEEILSLANEINILPLTGEIEDLTCETLSKFHLGSTVGPLTECLIGKTFFTKFKFENPRCFIHPVICGMTHSTTKQYSRAFHSCLRLLSNGSSEVFKTKEESVKSIDASTRLGDVEVNDSIFLHPVQILIGKSPKLFFNHLAAEWISQYLQDQIDNEQVLTCLKQTLETLSQTYGNSKPDKTECDLFYPLEVSISHLDCILQIAQNVARIDRICPAKKIK